MSRSLGEQNYAQFADRYARFAATKPHNAHYDRPAVRSLLPPLEGLRALDAGTGPGFNAEWMVDSGAAVTAIDVTPAFIDIARARLGERADVRLADLAGSLPFADGSFDVVLCALVLDYIEDWGPTFSEFARLLSPGGALVFSCGHPQASHLLWRDRVAPNANYFEVERGALRWHGFGEPPPVLVSFRRPLGEMLNPLISVGLQIDHVLETRPTAAFHETAPEDAAFLDRNPGFLCVRAHRRSGSPADKPNPC